MRKTVKKLKRKGCYGIEAKERNAKIVERYINGENTNQLSDSFGLSTRTVWEILNKNNVKIRKNWFQKRKYKVNESFFEKIDTQEKAYILGFIYADGCISSDHNHLSITISKRDIEILKFIKKNIRFNGKIEFPPHIQYSGRYKNCKPECKLRINRGKMGKDLIKLGCIPAKSLILKFPTFDQVPENLIHHFVRGYFDGDGGVSVSSRNKNTQLNSYIVGTKDFLEKISEIFYKYSGVKVNIRKSSSIYIFAISGNKLCRLLYNYIYKDSCFSMKRKRYIFDKVFKLLLNKESCLDYKSRYFTIQRSRKKIKVWI